MASGQTRWWEYLWAHLGQRRLSRGEWKALEGLVCEEATKRFRTREPTTFQMLLAACDVRERHPSVDALVDEVRLAARRGEGPGSLPAAGGEGARGAGRVV